ncbi:3657_t:CDS:1 [Dentiscutata erythropus]|uniref:3657_t:CDS:1 n=1 Tax=Dentiscutata erythropus TaxID=1348616 RepID=A0A9N9HTZ4_9GLOM|nr:3657_t:CDS:1 [Dentiscutata erythropus]
MYFGLFKKTFNFNQNNLFRVLLCFLTICNLLKTSANEGVPSTPDMENLVQFGFPQWNFAKALGHDTCAADHAILGDGTQHPPAKRKTWPIPGEGGCGDITYENLATYYIKKWCGDHFRVLYTLYFPKDGFKDILFVDLGHDHDFESIIMTWKNISGFWYRDELIMSRHHDWRHEPWDNVRSFDYNGIQEGIGLEHPKIFVGWVSHAMFNDKNIGPLDPISQYTDNEYRYDDHQLWANYSNSLIEVTDDNYYGQKFKEFNWGDKATAPIYTAEDLCNK